MPRVLVVDNDRIVDTAIGAMPVDIVIPHLRSFDSTGNSHEQAPATRLMAMSDNAIGKYRRPLAGFSYNDSRTGRHVRPAQAVHAQYNLFTFTPVSECLNQSSAQRTV